MASACTEWSTVEAIREQVCVLVSVNKVKPEVLSHSQAIILSPYGKPHQLSHLAAGVLLLYYYSLAHAFMIERFAVI